MDTLREGARSHTTNDASDLGDEKRRRFRCSQRDVREETMYQTNQRCISDDTRHC